MKKLGQLHLPSFLRSLQYRVYVASFIVHQAPIPSVFAIFQCKANVLKCTRHSRCSLVHILPTSSSKSVSIPSVFLRLLCEIELSLQSRVHFADLIFQKYSEHFSFYRFLCANRALVTVLYTFCRPHLPKVLRVATELSLQSCALLFQKCSAPVSL